ncbi:MAG: ABC transporter ATP-binding protein [Methylomicrobium sp.]
MAPSLSDAGSSEQAGIQVRLGQLQPIPLDIDLQCRAGEILVLAGPSGSGKTTVLRSIAGLYRPDTGRIVCRGEVWQDQERRIFMPAHRRAVGLVFQHYALFPHFTALGNIIEALAHLPKPQRRDRARKLLKRVHLEGLEDRYPAQLSGGQQQRVAVARALAREPHVLLLDEPFSAVDQVTRRRLYRELLDLRRSLPVPILLVTHDLDEAAMLADRLCVLHRGVTLQCGNPHEVATRPVNATVARLMDQSNLFTGICLGHAEDRQKTLLRWNEIVLEASYQPGFSAGERVYWMIHSSSILLHRRNRPVLGSQENPFFGVISEFVVFGGQANFRVELNPHRQFALSMSVPLHVAKRNALAEGESIGLSLLAEGIHLMPYPSPHRSKQDDAQT